VNELTARDKSVNAVKEPSCDGKVPEIPEKAVPERALSLRSIKVSELSNPISYGIVPFNALDS
jgi:hypothetical protein